MNNKPKQAEADARAVKRSRIAQLNNVLRTTGSGGRVVVTRSVIALGPTFLEAAVQALRDFDAFDPDNDPYGEHDCAIFDVEGHTLMFKIDYYDRTLTYGAEDPSDSADCIRVLTLMFSSDY